MGRAAAHRETRVEARSTATAAIVLVVAYGVYRALWVVVDKCRSGDRQQEDMFISKMEAPRNPEVAVLGLSHGKFFADAAASPPSSYGPSCSSKLWAGCGLEGRRVREDDPDDPGATDDWNRFEVRYAKGKDTLGGVN